MAMERPERPSRHRSNPVKFPSFQTSFSSDSDSEVNDNDVPIQITYYQNNPGSSTATAAPSTSTSTSLPQGSQANTETPSNNMIRESPMPLRVTLSPIPVTSREEETHTEQPQESARRKRSAVSSAAASIIFDSVDTLIGSSSSNRGGDSPERPLERFQHSDYVIRPRSFCNIDCGNAIRPPAFKLKRSNGPIDLTPTTSNRESSCQAPVVTSSFSLRGNSSLPTNAESTQNNFFSRTSSFPTFMGPAPRSDHQAASSSILRQFDEICASSPLIRRRHRGYSVRFIDSGSTVYPDPSHNDSGNSRITRESSRCMRNSLDDLCNFLFNDPSPSNNSDNQRSPPTLAERAALAELHPTATADIINRHVNTSEPDLVTSDINNESNIIDDVNLNLASYIVNSGSSRNDLNTSEAMELEQSNDDVIVVETPERPPLPGSPDPYLVPSSRSPSPPPLPPPAPSTSSQSKRDKSNRSGDVPTTLQDLNQTLVSLLECPVCLDHATPPIYQCGKGHILCQSCHPRLTTCPICRSRLPGDRNSAMEKVAEKLMYPCKNTVTGCSLMLKLDDKQQHEEGCGFRHYACIVTSCHWKGYKPELVVHLQSNHPDKLISGGNNQEVHVPLTSQVGGSMIVSHHWIQSAHNEVFIVIFHVDLYKRIMKGCVIYIGSPDKADKFAYLFELKQRVSPFRKLSYSRTTHADTVKLGQPLSLSNDFSINIDMARLYRPDDSPAHASSIPVYVSILPVD